MERRKPIPHRSIPPSPCSRFLQLRAPKSFRCGSMLLLSARERSLPCRNLLLRENLPEQVNYRWSNGRRYRGHPALSYGRWEHRFSGSTATSRTTRSTASTSPPMKKPCASMRKEAASPSTGSREYLSRSIPRQPNNSIAPLANAKGWAEVWHVERFRYAWRFFARRAHLEHFRNYYRDAQKVCMYS
jgi:hypothetical protein